MVLTAHVPDTFAARPVGTSTLLFIFGNGALGVSIFFAISGFLITTLLLSEFRETGDISLKAFYLRRAFRILPAFYTYLTVIGVLSLAGAIVTKRADFLSAAVFVWNYYWPAHNWFLGHTWSLSVEEQFYLLWPLALVTLKPRRAAILALILIALAPAVRLLMYLLVPSSRVHIPVMLHTRVDVLMFGCVAALLWDEPKFKRLLQWVYRRHVPAVALCFLLIISPCINRALRGGYALSVGWTLESACITVLLLWAIDHPATRIGRLLNWRPIAFIGVMSYSLYLWQQLFLTSLNQTTSGRFPLNLACCFLAAFMSYTVIERPFLRLRHRLASRPSRDAKQIDPIDRPAGPGI